MSDLSDESRELLAREASFDEPTPEDLERNLARLHATLGFALPTAIEAPAEVSPGDTAPVDGSAATPVPAGAGLGLGTRLVLLAAAAGVVVGVGLSLRPEPPARTTPRAGPPSAPRAPLAVRDVPVPGPAPGDTPAELAPSPAARPRSTGRPEATAPRAPVPPAVLPVEPSPEPSASDRLAEEMLIVSTAEAHLRRGRSSEALALFDRYLAEYPAGTLRQESVAGRIVALCRLGRPEGATQVERFVASYPRSPSIPRLRAACERDDVPESEP